jgi:hypothetical protein
MLQFHTEILSAKLSIHEDRHGKLLGGGEQRTHILTVKILEEISVMLLHT